MGLCCALVACSQLWLDHKGLFSAALFLHLLQDCVCGEGLGLQSSDSYVLFLFESDLEVRDSEHFKLYYKLS